MKKKFASDVEKKLIDKTLTFCETHKGKNFSIIFLYYSGFRWSIRKNLKKMKDDSRHDS
jgi:hypothetical protein